MRLQSRLRQLESALPKCDGRVRRLAREGYLPTEADRCPRCGGCHVLVIEEEVVETGPDETLVPTQPEATP